MNEPSAGYRPAEPPVSTGDWLLSIFLASLPLIGFIMLLVWAFGGGVPQSKANWAKATLIWMVCAVVLAGAAIFFVTLLSLTTASLGTPTS